ALNPVGRAGGQGRVWWSMLWGSNPDARNGAPPFEGGASTCSAKHRDSPCLLVKGADCAGVCLAVLAWLCPGLSRDARSRFARIELWPRQFRRTAGSNVGPGNRTVTGAPLGYLSTGKRLSPALTGRGSG